MLVRSQKLLGKDTPTLHLKKDKKGQKSLAYVNNTFSRINMHLV